MNEKNAVSLEAIECCVLAQNILRSILKMLMWQIDYYLKKKFKRNTIFYLSYLE